MSKYLNRIIIFLSIFLAVITLFIVDLVRRQDQTYDFNVYKTMHSPDYRLIGQPAQEDRLTNAD